MQPPVRIAILRTGSTAEAVLARYGDYDRWFIDAMSHRDGIRFEVHDVTRIPPPAIDRYDGAIVTGSTSAVYAAEPWMPPLTRFLQEAVARCTPVLGVCFGAQILAHALGSRVSRSPRGWEIGGVRVRLTDQAAADPILQGIPPVAPVLATHEDRIEGLSRDVVLLAGNDAAPVQAFRAGRCVWGVQFHPEITPTILEILIRQRREGIARDAGRRGVKDTGSYVEALLEELRGWDVTTGRRLLDNFADVCASSRAALGVSDPRPPAPAAR